MAETIGIIANLALALSLVVALVFGIAEIKAAAKERRERLTLETLRNFQTKEFAELILYVINNKVPATEKEMNVLPANERIMFIQFGQQMESLGLLVAEHLINHDLVDKTLGAFVNNAWDKYKGVVMDMRGKDPFLNEYFQWLAEQIDKRMKDFPRQPFYKNHEVAE